MLALTALPASANPTGGVVQAGNITITDVAGLTTITQGDMRGIVNWQDFSIGALETTRFIQPSSGAATLNRVTGGLPSNIHGALEANGHVFLINPNGVLVGAQGRVDTAGFVASALNVPDGEFLGGGDMTFSGPSLAGVVNLGTITASHGDVVLMARTVENEGTISAPNGTAALAAGNEIFFKPSGNDRVVVKSAASGSGGGVRNSGTIEAAQAELKAAGGNTNGLAVNNSGIVRATGISRTKSGRVRLSAGGRGGSVVNTGRISARNSDHSGGEVTLDGGPGGSAINEGTIDASAKEAGQSGGKVEVLGDTITIGNGSVIDVSGSNGGLVAIGISALKAAQATPSGGIATLAQDPDARAAQQVTIHAGSSILANSTGVGNGGKIVSWAENRSVIGGVLEVKGGEFGGDGGLIETSAYRGLIITPDTQISALAPAGKAGTWLIDPIYNIRIVDGLGVTNNQDAPGFEPNGDDSIIGATLIVNRLNAGTNVTISTTSAFGPTIGTGTQAGNISVEGAIQKTAGGPAKLTLNAVGAVDLQASIAGAPLPSNLSVEINAGAGGVTQNALAVLAAKDLTITTIDGGSVTLNGAVLADT
ncbi:MAG TPA: filamentous hemagglutinin N-terminal domain-containing protein, partial [Verrucomicrobiales bacterium]|nr:filamentous hemagglutinin N-terminal domain-containing protein [Verrucomicrobiales bacterium]